MSPLAADAASRLTLNSRRDAFFTLPWSLNSVVAFNTLFMISPICRPPTLAAPAGIGTDALFELGMPRRPSVADGIITHLSFLGLERTHV